MSGGQRTGTYRIPPAAYTAGSHPNTSRQFSDNNTNRRINSSNQNFSRETPYNSTPYNSTPYNSNSTPYNSAPRYAQSARIGSENHGSDDGYTDGMENWVDNRMPNNIQQNYMPPSQPPIQTPERPLFQSSPQYQNQPQNQPTTQQLAQQLAQAQQLPQQIAQPAPQPAPQQLVQQLAQPTPQQLAQQPVESLVQPLFQAQTETNNNFRKDNINTETDLFSPMHNIESDSKPSTKQNSSAPQEEDASHLETLKNQILAIFIANGVTNQHQTTGLNAHLEQINRSIISLTQLCQSQPSMKSISDSFGIMLGSGLSQIQNSFATQLNAQSKSLATKIDNMNIVSIVSNFKTLSDQIGQLSSEVKQLHSELNNIRSVCQEQTVIIKELKASTVNETNTKPYSCVLNGGRSEDNKTIIQKEENNIQITTKSTKDNNIEDLLDNIELDIDADKDTSSSITVIESPTEKFPAQKHRIKVKRGKKQ